MTPTEDRLYLLYDSRAARNSGTSDAVIADVCEDEETARVSAEELGFGVACYSYRRRGENEPADDETWEWDWTPGVGFEMPPYEHHPGQLSIWQVLALNEDLPPPPELREITCKISAELVSYLAKHPEDLYEIEPRQFEKVIAEILASFAWEVQLTPRSKDGGYDIFGVVKDIAGVKSAWIIECKRYKKERKVGVGVARQLFGVKTQLGVSNALLVTTSNFARGVEAWAASRWDFDLKNYAAVVDWLNTYRPNPQGQLYIKDSRLILPGQE